MINLDLIIGFVAGLVALGIFGFILIRRRFKWFKSRKKTSQIGSGEISVKLDEILKEIKLNKKQIPPIIKEGNNMDNQVYDIIEKIDERIDEIEKRLIELKDFTIKSYIAWDYSSHNEFRTSTMSKFLKISKEEIKKIKDDLIKDGVIKE